MQVLAVGGIAAACVMFCVVIYLIGRTLQRRGHDLTFADPRYPESMQHRAAGSSRRHQPRH